MRVKRLKLTFLVLLAAVSINIVVKNVFAEGATYTFTVDVSETPALKITLLDQNNQVTTGGTIRVTPSMAYAGFNEVGLNVKVGTSSVYGYTLAMQVANTDLLDSSTRATIPTLAVDETDHPNGYTCSVATQENCDFTVNTWGFRVASNTSEFPAGSNYLPVPNMKTLEVYTNGATNGNVTQVYFGSRVNAAKPAGSYSTTIDFVAVANVGERPYMQDMTNFTITAQMNEVGSTAYLYDARDEKSYLVGKLADGKYWMLENLALDPATLSSGVTLSQNNTNMPVVDSAGFGTTFAGLTSTTAGFGTHDTPQINTNYKTTEVSLAMGQSGTGKVGVYYNYCAASAGTYCMDSNSGSGNASYDICPAGWRMPTGGPSGEYQNLRNQYLSDGDVAEALRMSLPGYFLDSEVHYQGLAGYLWSSTFYDPTAAYSAYAYVSSIQPQGANDRFYGFSVRCVYDEDYIGVKTMQDLAALSPAAEAKMLARMETGKAYSLKDTRDGKYYRVAKLADGRVWMLDNLALDPATLTTTLTAANTNMDPNTAFTLPSSISADFGSFTTAQINTDSKNTDVALAAGQSGTGKVGVYYTYCAASAGTYCMDYSSGSGDASYDICPAGWRIPTGGPGGEYQNLYTAYNSNAANYTNALQIPLSGDYNGSSAGGHGSRGRFWSSTFSGAGTMYGLGAGSSDVYPDQYSNYRNSGFSVRCILKSNPVTLSIRTLQDLAAESLSVRAKMVEDMSTGQAYTLRDTRDNTYYRVAKLADGRVWMLDNLALDPTDPSVTINESNTNATAAQLSAFLDSETGVKNVSTGFNSYTDARINTDSKNTDVALALGQSGTGKVGVYYNYCAVTAGTYCMDSNSGSGDAQYDICPKGWRLPTGGASGEYHVLYSATTNAGRNYVDDLKLPLSGYFNGSDTYVQGTTGYFRSSTYASTADMHSMAASASGIYLYDVNNRQNGFSIRCVLSPYLQEMDQAKLSALLPSTGATATLIDSRDKNSYRVAKLADGKYWTLDNLALGGSSAINLTPSDTNISANFTLPASISAGIDPYTTAHINADYKNTNISLATGRPGTNKIGVYYNYCAASAGTYCMDSSSGSGDASYDICPKGWRMPTGGPSGEYQSLYNATTNAGRNYVDDLKLPLSGNYFADAVSYGAGGLFWSSTFYNTEAMHIMAADTSNVYPQTANGRPRDLSVRCVKN